MALVSDHGHGLDHGLGGLFRARAGRTAVIGRRIREALAAWAHRRAVYRTRRALESVSDRTLRDIGLDRSAILSAAVSAADRQFGRPHADERPR